MAEKNGRSLAAETKLNRIRLKSLRKYERERFQRGKRLESKWYPRDDQSWDTIHKWFVAMDGMWPFVGAIDFVSDFFKHKPFIVSQYDPIGGRFKKILNRRFETGMEAESYLRKKYKGIAFWNNVRERFGS